MPKILFIDIETSPILANVWGLWKQNISLDMIEDDWYIMSFSAKWLGERDVLYMDTRMSPENDGIIVRKIWSLFDEADFVIAHNGDKFDVKKINTRFILNGLQPPSPYKTVDTLKLARGSFAFTSNKLAFLTDKLCTEKKMDHGKYPGYKLWKECMAGNMEAWNEMEAYNKQDVVSLEELYLALRPWAKNHPVFSMFTPQVEEVVCPRCGSTSLQKRGKYITNAGVYQRYQCQDCGGWSKNRYTETDKQQKLNLPSSC